MPELISSLIEQPIMLVAMVVLVGLFAYAAMKRLVKLALVLVLGFAGLSAYFTFTGAEPPDSFKKIQAEVGEKLKAGAKSGAQKVTKRVGDEIKEATLDSLFRSSKPSDETESDPETMQDDEASAEDPGAPE